MLKSASEIKAMALIDRKTAIGSLLADSNSSRDLSLGLSRASDVRMAAKTAGASVEETIALRSREVSKGRPIMKKAPPNKNNAVKKTPAVERSEPRNSSLLTLFQLVSNPPLNRMKISARVPT